jgi:glycosyltransferase involved in cell wall biosynthesis
MMRILFVTPFSDVRGDTGFTAAKLCQELAKIGHNVTLCTNRNCTEKYLMGETPLFRTIEVENGKYALERFDKRRNVNPILYYYGYLRASYRIFKFALELTKKEEFDIIHALTEVTMPSLLLKKVGWKIPPIVLVIYAANFCFDKSVGSLGKRLYKIIQREILKKTLGKQVKAIAVLGEWHEERIRNQLQLHKDFPIVVIREGGEIPKNFIDKGVALRKIGLGDYNDKTIFLFFGTLRKDKGIEHLLKAISHLSSNKFRLLIAGSPVEYSEHQIISLVKEMKVEEKVILHLKYIPEEEISYYFFASDALVLPYTKKYLGGSGPLFRQGCIHKLPSIVTDVSEMGSIVKAYNIGLVAEAENPTSIAERMEEFLNLSEEEKRKLGENAFNFAKQHTWDKVATRFADLYGEIIWKSTLQRGDTVENEDAP